MKILSSFEKLGKNYWIVIGFTLIGVLGILDLLTGSFLIFSPFYMIPIALVTWLVGTRCGIIAAIVSVFAWILAHVLGKETYPQPIFFILNSLIEFIALIIVVLMLSAIKSILEHEKKFAQIDYLTGAMNSRFFYDFLQMEIRRSNRYNHSFTLAYFDIDNFKTMNDRFGHNTGDEVLRTLVDNAKKHLRTTDVIARLGGDEFAILLTETHHEAAQVALAKIQNDILSGMKQNNWEVTISMGVLTCTYCIESTKQAQEIIRLVDNLMYSVKRNGKNAIAYSSFVGESKKH